MAQLSIIELIIRKTAVQKNIAESIVEKVINHKFKSVHDAHERYKSIEDSGFGTYKVRPKVVIKRIAKIERYLDWLEKELQDGKDTITEKRLEERRILIEKLIDERKHLESKI